MIRTGWPWLLAFALCFLAATGCATTTHTVSVPVPVPCDPPKVDKPTLPIDALPTGSTIFDQVKALWATVETLEAYAGQLNVAIDACRGE